MINKNITQLVLFSTIILFWFLLVKTKIFSILLLPAPEEVLRSLYNLFYSQEIIPDIISTLYRLIIGLLLGLISGLFAGLIIGLSKKIDQATEFWLDFLRSIPAPALIPIFLLFFGIDDSAKIALTAFITGLLMTISTAYAVKNINKTRIMVAKTMRLSKITTFIKIALPDALPNISSGIRISISFALIVVIFGEMIMGAVTGLGNKIIEYQLLYETADMYAVIILTGLIGYLANKSYLVFEKKYIHWMGK